MNPDETAIYIENLSKCYQVYANPKDRLKQMLWPGKKKFYTEFWALKNINLCVNKGEAVGIIGLNGSGKSTLLQLICKILAPTEGQVIVNGRIAALLELGAGFNPDFTGRENVYLNGAILGFDKSAIAERMDKILAFADIGHFIDQPTKTYSSGMFVRLAFAVQVCVEPQVLIVDEALAVGDIFFQQKCYKKLTTLLDQGTTILLVSHSMNQVEQFCQRALLLEKGKALFWGRANEAVKHYYLSQQANNYLLPPSVDEQSLLNKEIYSETDDLPFWPDKNAFLTITPISQVSNTWGHCLNVAICNQAGVACNVFQQEDIASFFYEFELLQDIEIPMVGVVIQNQQGIIVHGKGSIEYGTTVPTTVKKGEHLFIRQDIKLELAMGEYTFEVGLATISHHDYQHRSLMSYEELYPKSIRICHLPNVGLFYIGARVKASPVQLLHHGIANLAGYCQVAKTILKKTVIDHEIAKS